MTERIRPVDLSHAVGIEDAMRRIAIVRFAELLTHASSLARAKPDDVIALRDACLRLHGILGRFVRRVPALFESLTRLDQLCTVLGDVHACDAMLASLPSEFGDMHVRIRAAREEGVARIGALIIDGFSDYGPLEGLTRFTGLGYGFGEAAL